MIQSQVPAVWEMLQQPLAQQGALSMQQIHSAVMQTPAVPLELYSIQQHMLATAVEGVQKVFGETGKCLQHTLMLSYFLSFRQTSIQ